MTTKFNSFGALHLELETSGESADNPEVEADKYLQMGNQPRYYSYVLAVRKNGIPLLLGILIPYVSGYQTGVVPTLFESYHREKICLKITNPGARRTWLVRLRCASAGKTKPLVTAMGVAGRMKFDDLAVPVAKRLDATIYVKPVWYTMVVQLDLEARGIIERKPGGKAHAAQTEKKFVRATTVSSFFGAWVSGLAFKVPTQAPTFRAVKSLSLLAGAV